MVYDGFLITLIILQQEFFCEHACEEQRSACDVQLIGHSTKLIILQRVAYFPALDWVSLNAGCYLPF